MHPIIFDMDGLLIDSEPLWRRAEVQVFGAAGLSITEPDCLRTMGLRIDEVVRFWEQERGWTAPAGIGAAVVERVAELVRTQGELLPGAREAVLHASSGPLALATSSAPRLIDAFLDRSGLSFPVIASAAEVPFGKPHPAVYLLAAERLGVAAERCIAIEDSLPGLIAAKAARMRCAVVPSEPHPGFALADVRMDSLHGLADFLTRA